MAAWRFNLVVRVCLLVAAGIVQQPGTAGVGNKLYIFVTLNIPGSYEGTTSACCINDSGYIAGSYLANSSLMAMGFVLAPGGAITSFSIPGGNPTPTGINAEGVVTGYGSSGSFIRAASGAITTFAVPASRTQAFGINALGVVTGYYQDTALVIHGFVRAVNGTLTDFDAPGAGFIGGGTFPSSINDAGVVAGYYVDLSGVWHSFLRYPNGAMTVFDVPGAGTLVGEGTRAFSINQAGATTGYYADASGTQHGFLRNPDASIVTFDGLSGQQTDPMSIDAAGIITGWCADKDFVLQGFVRFGDGAIATFNAGGAPGLATFPTSINNKGWITGYIRNGVHGDGFLAIPRDDLSRWRIPAMSSTNVIAPAC